MRLKGVLKSRDRVSDAGDVVRQTRKRAVVLLHPVFIELNADVQGIADDPGCLTGTFERARYDRVKADPRFLQFSRSSRYLGAANVGQRRIIPAFMNLFVICPRPSMTQEHDLDLFVHHCNAITIQDRTYIDRSRYSS